MNTDLFTETGIIRWLTMQKKNKRREWNRPEGLSRGKAEMKTGMLPVSLVIASEVLSGAPCVTLCLVQSKDRGNGGSDETVGGPTSESD